MRQWRSEGVEIFDGVIRSRERPAINGSDRAARAALAAWLENEGSVLAGKKLLQDDFLAQVRGARAARPRVLSDHAHIT